MKRLLTALAILISLSASAQLPQTYFSTTPPSSLPVTPTFRYGAITPDSLNRLYMYWNGKYNRLLTATEYLANYYKTPYFGTADVGSNPGIFVNALGQLVQTNKFSWHPSDNDFTFGANIFSSYGAFWGGTTTQSGAVYQQGLIRGIQDTGSHVMIGATNGKMYYDTTKYLPKYNPTATGILTAPNININGAAGAYRSLYFSTSGVLRWGIFTGIGAETGGNNGSDWALAGYGDSYTGTPIHTPISANRKTGSVSVEDTLRALHFLQNGDQVANDNAVVHLTGTETITANKSFIGSQGFTNPSGPAITLGTGSYQQFRSADNTKAWFLGYASNDMDLNISTSGQPDFNFKDGGVLTRGLSNEPVVWLGDLSAYVPLTGASQLNIGNLTKAGKSMYLFTTFTTASERMFVLSSNDGKQFNLTQDTSSFTPSSFSTNHVRDPSILYYNNTYYAAHTSGIFGVSNYIEIITSPDLVNWTHLTDVSVSSLGATPYTWSPEWTNDTDTGLPYLLFNAGNEPTLQLYSVKPTDGTFTSWNSPSIITGTSLPPNWIDPFRIKVGSTYYLFYKNENTKYIEIYKSTSPLSGYTAWQTGDFAGWGSDVEGPSVVQVDSTRYRIYFDKYTAGTGTAYSETTDNTFATGWSTAVNIQSPVIARHGTVIHTTDINVFRNATNASASVRNLKVNSVNVVKTVTTGTIPSFTHQPTITATANGQKTYNVVYDPTYTNGSFTGVNNYDQMFRTAGVDQVGFKNLTSGGFSQHNMYAMPTNSGIAQTWFANGAPTGYGAQWAMVSDATHINYLNIIGGNASTGVTNNNNKWVISPSYDGSGGSAKPLVIRSPTGNWSGGNDVMTFWNGGGVSIQNSALAATNNGYIFEVTGTTALTGLTTIGTSTEKQTFNSTSTGINMNTGNNTVLDANGFGYQWYHTKSTTNTSDTYNMAVYSTASSLVAANAFSINGLGNVGLGAAAVGNARVKTGIGSATIVPLLISSATQFTGTLPTGGIDFQTTALRFGVTAGNRRFVLSNDAAPTNGQLLFGGAADYTAATPSVSNGVTYTPSAGGGTWGLGAITPTSTNGVSAATMAFMDATSSVQTQINAKMANPMTTLGDIIYGGAIGVPTRLPAGSNGYYLSMVSGSPSWVSPATSSTDVTAQTAATSIGTPSLAANSSYRVGGYVNITAISTDVLKMELVFTDLNGNTVTKSFYPQGLTSELLSTVGYYTFPTMDIRAKSGTSVAVSFTLAVGGGTIAYDAGATFTKLN